MTEVRVLHILYVEDHQPLRDMICALLCSDARKVVAVGSAEEALTAFDSERFHVLITDISLPTLSGIELARRLRERSPQLWVIVSSGYEWTLGLEALAPRVAWLKKPFDIEQLEALLASVSAASGAPLE